MNWKGEHFKIESLPRGRARSTIRGGENPNIHLDRPLKLAEIPKSYKEALRDRSPVVCNNRDEYEKFRSLDPNLVMNPHQHQLKPPLILPKHKFNRKNKSPL